MRRFTVTNVLLICGLTFACGDSTTPVVSPVVSLGAVSVTPTETDRAALVALYEAAGGASWSDNTNWMSDRPLSRWHGVQTNRRGRVTRLSLRSNNLAGPIPPEIGSLGRLQSLLLDGNALRGRVPPEIGQLSRLRELVLAHNQVEGALPPEMGGLARLKYLAVSSTGLSGPIPVTFGDLGLTSFYFASTDLCVPASLQTWLAGIRTADGFRPCSDRAVLVALYDATGGADWGDDTNWLSDRPLGEWYGVETDSEGRVTRLTLPRNGLTGNIPAELGDLVELVQLDLRNNDLTGNIPPELGQLSKLEIMRLPGNRLAGAVPPELGDLAKLEILWLHSNALAGPLPLQLEGLPLDGFRYHSTDLCVPADDSFRAWLNGIRDHRGTGSGCPAAILLDPPSLTLMVGDTATATATVVNADGQSIPLAVTWSSSDSAVVSVDEAGLVTAAGAGSAEVIVTLNSPGSSLRAAADVTVEEPAWTLVVDPPSLALTVGETATVTAAIVTADERFPLDVTWSSSNAAVVSVDEAGLVTATGAGSAEVIATRYSRSGTNSVTASADVTVEEAGEITRCVDGHAGRFPCHAVDLVAQVSRRDLRPGKTPRAVSDIWGWTDPETNVEYALVGRRDGLSIVDLSIPTAPRPVAYLASETAPTVWRDMKVYADHVYVVADGGYDHGMQILDLTRLRDLTEFTELQADAHYSRVSTVHNIAINEETGFAYAVGDRTCGGGLHMIDLSNPTNPSFAGCYAAEGTGFRGTGYTHDVQCVVYRGPDTEHAGREICVASNENAVVVSDVTDKANPTTLSVARYASYGYIHQGWFDEDHRYFYENDELDESLNNHQTRMLVWDMTDLDDPILAGEHFGPTTAVDHNLYVHGDLIYHSNYTFGVRIIDISDPGNPVEAGYFDTVPEHNDQTTNGSWSTYPYFESGLFVVTSEAEGLFILKFEP